MERKEGLPLIKEPSLDRLLEIVKIKNPKNILEIGTCIGFSGICMLKVCSGHLTTIEIDKDRYNLAEANFKQEGLEERVCQILGDASKIFEQKLIKQKFDLIFLDGPKGQYNRQLPYLIELLNEDGILFADNVLFRGYVENPQSAPRRYKTIVKRLKEFIEECKSNKSLRDVSVEHIGDGLLIAKRR